jgi:hypothetical protein
MADTPALGAGGRKAVRVRIPLPAPEVGVFASQLGIRIRNPLQRAEPDVAESDQGDATDVLGLGAPWR